MKKSFLMSTAALALISSAAYGADLPPARGAPIFLPPSEPAFSWSGFYVGANVGYGGDRFRYPFSASAGGAALLTGSASITSSGVLGGVQAGYNYTFGNHLVAGIEADFDGAGISGRAAVNGAVAGVGTFGLSAGSKINYIGTARGRLGYTFDRVMLYATGGFAYSQDRSSVSANIAALGLGAGGTVATTRFHTGYTVGGGVEYAITNNVTFKTEYLYTQLNSKPLAAVALGGAAFALNERPSANLIRAGLNYKFDFYTPAPVVARY